MSRVLGLDLGTNSIGWAVVEREWNHISKKKSFDLIDKGVRVFPEGIKNIGKVSEALFRAGWYSPKNNNPDIVAGTAVNFTTE